MQSSARQIAVFALAIGCAGCGSVSYHAPSSSDPGVVIVQAKDLGAIRTNPDILGRDVGTSALFQDKSVWLYGDTFLAKPNAEGFGLISDSWSYTSDLNAQDGIGGFQERLDSAGAPTMILSLTSSEEAFNAAHNGSPCREQPCGARWALWPASIVVDPASGRALIFYGVVSALPGAFNFQGIGSSVATWESLSAQPQRPVLSQPIVPGHPDLMFSENEPGFGSASLIENGALYVYGCGVPSASSDLGCRLAKVDASQAQNRSAWAYYAGNGNWSSQIADAVPVFSGGPGGLTVSWNAFLGRYVAIYSASFSQNVMLRTAPSPEGPWSDEIVTFVAMQPENGTVYDAHSHAEYDLNGGQTFFVSYSRATGEFTSEARLVEVEVRAQPVP